MQYSTISCKGLWGGLGRQTLPSKMAIAPLIIVVHLFPKFILSRKLDFVKNKDVQFWLISIPFPARALQIQLVKLFKF